MGPKRSVTPWLPRSGALPKQLRRSLTWDQGSEMAQHAQLRINTGLAVYFSGDNPRHVATVGVPVARSGSDGCGSADGSANLLGASPHGTLRRRLTWISPRGIGDLARARLRRPMGPLRTGAPPNVLGEHCRYSRAGSLARLALPVAVGRGRGHRLDYRCSVCLIWRP